MFRNASVLCVGIIVALCFACAQLPPPAAPPVFPIVGSAASSPAASGPCDGANRIPFLKNAFMLSNYIPSIPVSDHIPVGTQPVPDPYCTSLVDAYNSAPDSFKAHLNGLKATFINNAKCADPSVCIQNSWGLIDRKTNDGYVGLSAGLWSGGPPKYSAFEEQISAALLGRSSPIKVEAEPDTATATVLAGLAHEIGHLKWWEGGWERQKCDRSSVPFGSQPRFGDHSWDRDDLKTDYYQYFGKQRNTNSPRGGVDKDKIKRQFNPIDLNQDLKTLYSGEWASMFATVTPDEDFVETYKLTVIQTILSKFRVHLPDGTVADIKAYATMPADPADSTKKYNLYNKIRWMQSCVLK